MKIHKQINKIDPSILIRMLEFAAHAVNNLESINEASELMEIDKHDGEILARMIVELGISGSTVIQSNDDFIKAKERLGSEL